MAHAPARSQDDRGGHQAQLRDPSPVPRPGRRTPPAGRGGEGPPRREEALSSAAPDPPPCSELTIWPEVNTAAAVTPRCRRGRVGQLAHLLQLTAPGRGDAPLAADPSTVAFATVDGPRSRTAPRTPPPRSLSRVHSEKPSPLGRLQ